MTTPFRARRSMRAALIAQEIVLIGGVGAGGTESILDVSDEVWTYDTVGRNWSRLAPTPPWLPPRRCPGVAAVGSDVHVWGGSGVLTDPFGVSRHSFENDWHILSRQDRVFVEVEASTRDVGLRPPPRYFPTLEFVRNTLVLFGGYTEVLGTASYLGDTWIRDGGRWRQVVLAQSSRLEPSTPEGRYGAMSTVYGDAVVVFGGFSGTADLADVWLLDMHSKEWTLLWKPGDSPGPRPRYAASCAATSQGFVVFGGRSRKDPKANYSDLWTFSIDERRWVCWQDDAEHQHYGPASRPTYHAKSAYCSDSHSLWILGGEGHHGHVSDFWRLDLRALEWEQIAIARHDDPLFW